MMDELFVIAKILEKQNPSPPTVFIVNNTTDMQWLKTRMSVISKPIMHVIALFHVAWHLCLLFGGISE